MDLPTPPLDNPPAGERLRLTRIAALALLQSGSGAAVGYAFLNRKQFPEPGAVMVTLGPVGTAVLLSAAALAYSKWLLPGRAFAFPSNVTLPLVFAALVRASVILWVAPQSAAFRPPEQLLPALLWTRPLVLATVAGIQFVALTAFVALQKRA